MPKLDLNDAGGDCKIADKLAEVHKWAHLCLDSMEPDDLHAAHKIGQKILNLLSTETLTNGIQFIAVFEALIVGIDNLNDEVEEMKHPKIIQ